MENDPKDLDLLFSVDEETLGKVIIKSTIFDHFTID